MKLLLMFTFGSNVRGAPNRWDETVKNAFMTSMFDRGIKNILVFI